MRFNQKFMVFLFLLCLSIVPALASEQIKQQGNLPIDFVQSQTSKNSKLTMVGGGLCGYSPEDAGTVTNPIFLCQSRYSYNSFTGCVVQYFDSSWKKIQEITLQPGESFVAPFTASYWQSFSCFKESYTCTPFQNAGCGEEGHFVVCDDDEMLRTRSCEGATTVTERCVPWDECSVKEKCSFNEEYGDCEGGLQKITLRYSDCSTENFYQSCSVSCHDPDGSPGDIRCSAGIKYECSGGSWAKIGTCGSGSNAPDECVNPSAPLGEELCFDGFYHTCTADGWKKGDVCTVATNIVAEGYKAIYDPKKKAVIARVKIKNMGEDMKDTHLIEMQVRPKGMNPLAVISNLQTCDPSHPENVHRTFMLAHGEEATLDLIVPREVLETGDYDIYLLSRHKCYTDLTQAQIADYEDYQLVGPFKRAKKIATIHVGTPYLNHTSISIIKIISFTLIGLGCLALYYGYVYVGGVSIGAGLLLFIIQSLL